MDTLRASLADPEELDREEAAAAARFGAAEAAEQWAVQGFAAASALLAEVGPRWERLQQLRDRALAAEGELRVAEHELAAAADRTARLERQAADAATAERQLDELAARARRHATLQEETEQLARQAERLRRPATGPGPTRRGAAHARCRWRRGEANSSGRGARSGAHPLGETEAALATRVRRGGGQRTTWVRDSQDASTKREALLVQFRDLREQRERIVHAGAEGDCPTCARPLGAEYSKVLGMLDRQLEEVVSNGNFYRQRMEQLKLEPPELAAVDRRREELEEALQAGRLEAPGLPPRPGGGALATEQTRLAERVAGARHRAGELPSGRDEQRTRRCSARSSCSSRSGLEAARFRAMADKAQRWRRSSGRRPAARTPPVRERLRPGGAGRPRV